MIVAINRDGNAVEVMGADKDGIVYRNKLLSLGSREALQLFCDDLFLAAEGLWPTPDEEKTETATGPMTPSQLRACVVEQTLDGQKPTAIAAMFKVKTQTVSNILFKARKNGDLPAVGATS